MELKSTICHSAPSTIALPPAPSNSSCLAANASVVPCARSNTYTDGVIY